MKMEDMIDKQKRGEISGKILIKDVYDSSCCFESEYAGLLKPLIYCHPESALIECAVSINYALAKKLSELKPTQRSRRLATCFEDILKTLPDNIVIKDFDVMFNPEYKVDVLKIMVDVCKRKPFRAIWPGKCNDGKLSYSEVGYPDFKTFSIDNYDVICITQGGRKP